MLTLEQDTNEAGRSASWRRCDVGCLAITAMLFATQAMAGEPHGIWKTKADQTGAYLLVEVLDCMDDRSKLCAVIRKVVNSQHQEIVGRQIFWNLEADNQNKWKNGRIWDVSNDKVYRAKVTLDGNTMRVEGCVAIFCDGQNWSPPELNTPLQ